MKFLALFITAAFLAGCSSSPKRTSTRYTAPSAEPVRERITAAQTHVTAARSSAEQASSAISAAQRLAAATSDLGPQTSDLLELRFALHQAKTAIDKLTAELLAADRALKTSQDRVTELETAAAEQTSVLNQTVAQKNAALDREAATAHETPDRHRAAQQAAHLQRPRPAPRRRALFLPPAMIVEVPSSKLRDVQAIIRRDLRTSTFSETLRLAASDRQITAALKRRQK